MTAVRSNTPPDASDSPQHQRTRILTTLVTGRSVIERENRILHSIQAQHASAAGASPHLPHGQPGQTLCTAVILEGLPHGQDLFADQATIQSTRIAAACPCCIGNLTMRVTLNRVLRQHPERLYISLANDTHLAQFREFLASPPYDAWLELTGDLVAA
ncbi:MAG: GTPase [Janthinobacterium lividum]